MAIYTMTTYEMSGTGIGVTDFYKQLFTIGLWTFGAEYLLLFEKDNTDYGSREYIGGTK
jgi:hypothetical protein